MAALELVGEASLGASERHRLLQSPPKPTNGATQRRRHRDADAGELPSRASLAGAVVALLLVGACTFLLVFGPADNLLASEPAVATTGAKLSATCQEAAAGPFWERLVPTHYYLQLHLTPEHFAVNLSAPNLGAPSHFNATANVMFSVQQATGCVLLNAQGMQFRRASLAAGGPGEPGTRTQKAAGTAGTAGTAPAAEQVLCGSVQECSSVVVPVTGRPRHSTLDDDLVAVDLGGVLLQPGSTMVLQLEYSGTLGPEGSGLYPSHPFTVCSPTAAGGGSSAGGSGSSAADDASGSEAEEGCRASVLMVTQLEPLGARQLLPCYDAPRFKAQFQVTLEVPSGLTVLSNMPPASHVPVPSSEPNASNPGGQTVGMQRVSFEPTPVMSPYLLAVAVGELEQLQPAAGSNKAASGASQVAQVRLWAVPGKAQQLRVAHAAATGALEFFTSWTGIEQPLTKFDFVAVPGKQGAMENWGLLLFDETRFLVNEATEGAYGAWLAADVVCHETAHQWFGNLVTTRDWTQLTVNEGVASFFEYKCVEAAFPQMPVQPLFFRATSPSGERLGTHEGPTQRALEFDDNQFVHPLVPQSELENAEGVITYSKGAALLRMLEAFMESRRPGSFQAGVKAFLQQHQGSVASVADLLSALADQAAMPQNAPTAPAGAGGAAELAAFAQLARQYKQQYEQQQEQYKEQHSLGSMGKAGGTTQDSSAEGSSSSGGNNNCLSVDNPLAAWLTSPGFPYLTLNDPAALEAGSSSSGELASAWAAAVRQQRRYCTWEAPTQLGGALGGAGSGGEGPTGGSCSEDSTQWWLPRSMAGVPAGGGSGGEALGIANPSGAGLFRTAYPNEHLHKLLAAVAGLDACYVGAGASYSSGCSSSSSGGVLSQPANIGSTECGSSASNASHSCQLDARPLLAAATVLADTVALAASGVYPAARTLQAAQAALEAPISFTGSGTYLLALPAAEALYGLRPLLASNASCAEQLHTFSARLLAPHAARALRSVLPGGVPVGPSTSGSTDTQRAQQDAFLRQLAASRLLWHAALLGDAATSAALCSSLPATPLWRYVRTAAGLAGCPAGFQPAGTQASASGSSTGAECRPANASGTGAVGIPSPDLLPAVYITAAAAPDGCAAALQRDGITPAAVAQALRECWENEEDGAEASRCIHALPFIVDKSALQESLTWLVQHLGARNATSGCSVGGARSSSSSSLPLTLAVRHANRRRTLSGLVATLLSNAAGRSAAAWQAVLQALSDNWTWGVQCGTVPALCGALEQLPEPWLPEGFEQLEQFLREVQGAQCSAAVRARVLGRAAAQRQRAAQDGMPEEVCSSLDH